LIKIAPVKFSIPKGSLEEATFKLLEESWTKVRRRPRTYRVFLDDPDIQVKMLRPQEIPTLVGDGLYDVGITGQDWVDENKADVEKLLDLEYGKIKLVIAIPDSYKYKSLDDMILDYGKKKRHLEFHQSILLTLQSLSKNANPTKNCTVQKILKLLLHGYAWELTKMFRFIYRSAQQKPSHQKMLTL